VTKLHALRAAAPPLLLIAVWALLGAATIAWVALVPGGPSYADGVGSLGGAVFATAALALLMGLGSRIAWLLAIFFHVSAIFASAAVGAYEQEAKALVVALLEAAALWLIWSGGVERHVRPRLLRRPRVDSIAAE
jgi:hypothetical protein